MVGVGGKREGGSHFCANSPSVGVKVRGSAARGVPQQGASDGGQRHRQRLVLIVSGHVGDALAAVTHLVCGANVEGRVVRGAGGAVPVAPRCGGLKGGGGTGKFRWGHGQGRGDGAVQPRDAAGITGEVLLRNGAAVRPILLAAVVLESTVTEHGDDTQQYHCGQYSSGYDNSSRCHPTSSPSNCSAKLLNTSEECSVLKVEVKLRGQTGKVTQLDISAK